MIIEINKDIDRYKETVIMGLTARQLIFSAASIVTGGGIVLLLYPLIGLTPSVYVAIPAVAPIALGGFYSFNGMNFYEFIRRKARMLFANHPLVYVSTEGEKTLHAICMEERAGKKTEKKSRKKREKTTKKESDKEEFEEMKKKTGKILACILFAMAAAIISAVVYQVKH